MAPISRRTLLQTATAAIATSPLLLVKPARAQSQQINLYSSRHYDVDDRLYEEFAERTGIRVNRLQGKADELIERIKSEGANSPADVLITVDAARLWRAEIAGIFQPTVSPVLDAAIPARLRHPEGLWFSLTKRARVAMYARDRVSPAELSTYEALAADRWHRRLAIRSADNVYNQSLVASLVAALGEAAAEDWCRGIVANMARPPRGGDMDQIKLVAAGQADVALANTYYLRRFAPGGAAANAEILDRMGVFFPNQGDRGAHINVSGGGVVAGAPNRAGAVAFLEYLVSPSAQAIFSQGNGEYPVVAGVPLDPVVADFGDFTEDDRNVAELGFNNAAAVRAMDRAGWR